GKRPSNDLLVTVTSVDPHHLLSFGINAGIRSSLTPQDLKRFIEPVQTATVSAQRYCYKSL
ncbi:MAG: hypothetical protein ACTSP4_14175, partial [Candidatus Hodarchaeales archaeon]